MGTRQNSSDDDDDDGDNDDENFVHISIFLEISLTNEGVGSNQCAMYSSIVIMYTLHPVYEVDFRALLTATHHL